MPEQKDFKHLVRIANTDLDGNKPLYMALRKIKGIGFMFANMVCSFSGIDKTKKTGYLSDEEAKKIDEMINNPADAPSWMLNRRKDYETGEDKHLLTGDIKFIQGNDIKRLQMIRSYRGSRHAAKLPVRGQNTRSNFRKNKGKVTGVKKKAAAPAAKKK